jgi:hypothetical protein
MLDSKYVAAYKMKNISMLDQSKRRKWTDLATVKDALDLVVKRRESKEKHQSGSWASLYVKISGAELIQPLQRSDQLQLLNGRPHKSTFDKTNGDTIKVSCQRKARFKW